MNFFEDWEGIARVGTSAVCAYIMLIIFLRISGKRTLTQMNAFDFVVTIALGSMLSSTILDKTLPLVEGLTGLLALIILQLAITWLSVRIPLVDRLIKATPAALVEHGEINKERMRRERITEDEIRSALRQGHWNELKDVRSVTLETNGIITVVYGKKSPGGV
jgi:uncharacterized membrane protein YcaP (DUF421 family)